MPSFSLRSKLILAMTLLVLGTSLATILIARHQVKSAYAGIYSKQVEGQIDYFVSRQEERLQSLAGVCEGLVEQADVQKALAEKNAVQVYQLLNQGLLNGMRAEAWFGQNIFSLLDRPQNLRPQDVAKFFDMRAEILVVDEAGRPLNNLRQGLPFRETALRRLTRTQLEKLTQSKRPKRLTRQQFGFAIIEDNTPKADIQGPPAPVRLAELVATPVFDANGRNLGALLVTVPFVNVDEKLLEEIATAGAGEAIQSGIWVDGVIHSRTIDPLILKTLAAKVGEEIREDTGASGEFDLVVQGVPHRVNFRELNPDSPFSRACQVGIYSLAPLREQQARLERLIASTGLFGAAGALLIILLLSRNLTNPLLALVRATEKIRHGDYSTRLPVRTRDEVGVLSRSFNAMSQDLELNRKYQSILSQVTDKEVAQALMQGGVSLGGEEREVTVLFCDIRGFTSLTEGMPPRDVIALLNTHMTAMTEVVHAHKGTVDKFVGDMIMALFGAPKSYGGDAARGAACALAMMKAREQLNNDLPDPVHMGIGIATGRVVAGCMGSEDRLNFTVLGEKVNLASRLCSAADVGGIYIDEATFHGLSGKFEAQSLGRLDLKGFSENLPVWRLG